MPRYTDYYGVVGSEIRQAREKLGYTQNEVADMVGVSRSAYSQYEIGKNAITMQVWLKIADTLGLDAYDVMRKAQEADK